MRFHDKVAVVTGGASGMDKEVAIRFVAEGGSVVINGRDAAKAAAAAHEIDPRGERVAVHVGDVALPATGEAVVKTRSTVSVVSMCCSTMPASLRRSPSWRSMRPNMTALSTSCPSTATSLLPEAFHPVVDCHLIY